MGAGGVLVAGLLLVKPGIWTDLAGFGVALVAFALGTKRREAPAWVIDATREPSAPSPR